ncbi:MAG TPA: GTPase ObgE [Actinomycetota bacterium]|nr:GTPase ObgE [Actinomycetota bacterium]
MAFVDEVTVFARGGRGGNGSASILREPYTPRGGPDGGDGGPGGDVVFEVSTGARDLAWLADHPHVRAPNGGPGGKRGRTGAAGEDLVIRVPDGTRVEDEDGLLADLVGEGARAVVARGGRGGRGNAAVATQRDRVPRSAEAGEAGEDRRLSVELRTVADLGLVGLPNAGKSTLLAQLTAAHPKIADYPFTTLSPNLGVAGEDERFVVADVPGLVEGAHEGRGLGHRFLRHVSRCRALVLVVDLASADPAADLEIVRTELGAYDPALLSRPTIVVGTKADLAPDVDAQALLGGGAIAVSVVTSEGMDRLRERLSALAKEAETVAEDRTAYVVLRPARPRFTVTREGGRFRVVGRGVERWVSETDLEDPAKVERLQRRLVKEGVERELVSAGARRGDEVLIGDVAFEFIPEGQADGTA